MWTNTSTGFHTQEKSEQQKHVGRRGRKGFLKMQKYPDMENQTLNDKLRTFELLNFLMLRNDLIPVFYTLTVKTLQILTNSQIWYAKKSKMQMAEVKNPKYYPCHSETPLHLYSL